MSNRPMFVTSLCFAVALAVLPSRATRATVLTFTANRIVDNQAATTGADYRYAHLFANSSTPGNPTYDGAPTAPINFSDYGDNVTGSLQTGVGKNGAWKYSYGTAGGDTSHIVADYPGADASPIKDASGYDYGTNIILNSYDALDPAYTFSAIPYYPDLGTTKRRVVILTAATDYKVVLQGFTIEDFLGQKHVTALDVIGINADNTTTTLWSAPNPDAVFGHASKTYTTTDFGGPLMYRALAIEFQEGANDINYIAFTNVQFAEFTPEPASLSLLAIGGLLVLRRR